MTNYSNKGGILHINTEQKLHYLKKSKFTIAVESVLYPGFETEKIVHAFQMHSIPIYYGAETIKETYNTNAFINVQLSQMEELIDRVQDVDNNKEKYIEMLMECPLKDRNTVKRTYDELEEFLYNIFSQDPQKAFRRPKYYYVDSVETSLKGLGERIDKSNIKLKKYYRGIKREIRQIYRRNKFK